MFGTFKDGLTSESLCQHLQLKDRLMFLKQYSHARLYVETCLRQLHFKYREPTQSEVSKPIAYLFSFVHRLFFWIFHPNEGDVAKILFQLGWWTPTDVFGFGCNRPAQLHNKLLGIQANLDDVVQQSEERSQREGGHEQSHHPKLDD